VRGTDRAKALGRIRDLAAREFDLVELWRRTSEVLAAVLPYYWSPCWYTLDPASLLITSHFNEDIAVMPSEWLAAEYYQDDVNLLRDIARSPAGIATLHESTGGDPTNSPRWQENIKYGGDQEMICALRSRTGDTWGAVGLYRDTGRPMFDRSDQEFLQAASLHLAGGARRALLAAEAKESDAQDAPGLLLLSSDWEIESTTPGTDQLLEDLPGGGGPGSPNLPPVVVAVASQVLRPPNDAGATPEPATARVTSRSGRWIVVHAAPLATPKGSTSQAAVIIEPAHPARIAPLLMSAYELTAREQDVTRSVLKGCSTTDIAAQLFISHHTVQEHLKHVFEKTGVRSRRDLVAKVFFGHYEPRVRDNETRAAKQRPLLGDPMPTATG
jgi:DNA-binding CsgD family transcriptional regulator/GAF domain-containing protein